MSTPFRLPAQPAALVATLAVLALAACQTNVPPASRSPTPMTSAAPPQPPAPPVAATAAKPVDNDPYIYMEDADGKRALDWAREQNARTFGVLQKEPEYAKLYADALTVVNAKERIPSVAFSGKDSVRNFWQDADHVRGIWRTATLASYKTKTPDWVTVLDLDALAASEKANWVWEGAVCLPPADEICMVQLSDGGKDAKTLREFNTRTRTFVANGFVSGESKQSFDWYDADTAYIGRDWGNDSMTESGYAYIVKVWKRGTPLTEAKEVFRGSKTDVSAGATVLRDAQGRAQAVIFGRSPSFFEETKFLLTDKGPVRLPFPLKSTIQGLVDNQLLLSLQQDFPERGLREGDLLSYDLAALKADVTTAGPTLVLRPAANQSMDGMGVTRDRLLVALYDDVKGTLISFSHGAKGWSKTSIPMPKDGSVDIDATADEKNDAIVTTRSFLVPTQQWLVHADTGKRELLKSLPAQFDASKDVVEQQWAVSTDGTRVPYFIVRPKNLKRDGTAPTLLYAYGGFQVSQPPFYSATYGKLWLERGGVLVLANIRGGGEFGPRWHNAGLKENRQKVFDDFYAVARSLIASKITSPRHLGIEGGSNGGLLMGVAMTQHPELFNAVVIQVPLLDMLRYTQIGAGASWVGEYGDPAVPAERAYIEKYSPYQQVKPGMHYPEAFFETSTKDDRVHPAHARKMAARLQEYGYPFYYYENIDGGHAADANLKERALRSALEFTYLSKQLMP